MAHILPFVHCRYFHHFISWVNPLKCTSIVFGFFVWTASATHSKKIKYNFFLSIIWKHNCKKNNFTRKKLFTFWKIYLFLLPNESSKSVFQFHLLWLARKAFVAASNKTPNSSREIFNGNDWEARRQFTAWKLLKIPYVIPPIIWD